MSSPFRHLLGPIKCGLQKRPGLYLFGFIALLGAVTVGCSQGSYPLDFFYEMHYQQTYKSHEPPRLSSPAGAVPYSLTPESASVADGQYLFQVNCAMCHGDRGKGDGNVLTTMITRYNYQPVVTPDLTSAQVKAIGPQGIEGFMVSGVVGMPSFAKLLSPEERKRIAEYVLTLQP